MAVAEEEAEDLEALAPAWTRFTQVLGETHAWWGAFLGRGQCRHQLCELVESLQAEDACGCWARLGEQGLFVGWGSWSWAAVNSAACMAWGLQGLAEAGARLEGSKDGFRERVVTTLDGEACCGA